MGNEGAFVQGGQTKISNWKTQLACTTSTCVSGYNSGTYPFDSPDVQACSSGTSAGGCGVQGIPTGVSFTNIPAFPTAGGGGTGVEITETSDNISGAGSGFQVLWPYNTGSDNTGIGCDSCTKMVENFYIWPGQNASSVENWELDMNSWKLTPSGSDAGPVYLGASFQCSVLNGGWQYNGQAAPGWQSFHTDYPTDAVKLNHDCPLPTGTLSTSGGISATATSFSVTPNSANSTVESGMIIWFDDGTNEEVFCQTANASTNTCTSALRGWAGTTAQYHAQNAAYSGSVHVQYHVTFLPGWTWTGTSTCSNNLDGYPNWCSAETGECVFIDYLYLNNVAYDFRSLYGTQTVDGTAGFSCLTVPAYSLTYPYDRVYDQKQIDQYPGLSSYPATSGEYIDRDNVTASLGIYADNTELPLVYSIPIP